MTTLPGEKQRNNSARLDPYKFKPGQSGNPNGRPKETLSKHDKLRLLSEMAHLNKDKVNPVEAIREHNRLAGDYPPVQHHLRGQVVIQIEFVPVRKLGQVQVTQELPQVADPEAIGGEIIEGETKELPEED